MYVAYIGGVVGGVGGWGGGGGGGVSVSVCVWGGGRGDFARRSGIQLDMLYSRPSPAIYLKPLKMIIVIGEIFVAQVSMLVRAYRAF